MGRRKNHDEQTGQPAVPESGAAVPPDTNIPAEKQPDPVSADPGAPAADGAGDLPAQDPAPAVDGDALAVGAETAEAEEQCLTASTIAAFALNVALSARIWTSNDVDLFCEQEAAIMADFVRANPEAPLLAMYKHLELTKRLQATVPNNADMLALSLFRHACLAAIEFLRCEAAEHAPAQTPPPAAAWPGERSFKVQDPAFSPTGFRPL